MTRGEAGQAVSVLNAGFPLHALESATVAYWVTEIAILKRADVALETSRQITRNCEQFPSLHEYRVAYRAVADRMNEGHEIEERYEAAPPPSEAGETLKRLRAGTVLRDMP